MITRQEILMGRDKQAPLTPEMEKNLELLLERVNILRAKYGRPMVVSSGYRPPVLNKQAGGATGSAHMTCEAVDFRDVSRELTNWIMQNQHLLEEIDIYIENPIHTPTWLHVQTRPTKSGRRIFNP
jgi:hypothetical protein